MTRWKTLLARLHVASVVLVSKPGVRLALLTLVATLACWAQDPFSSLGAAAHRRTKALEARAGSIYETQIVSRQAAKNAICIWPCCMMASGRCRRSGTAGPSIPIPSSHVHPTIPGCSPCPRFSARPVLESRHDRECHRQRDRRRCLSQAAVLSGPHRAPSQGSGATTGISRSIRPRNF